MGLQTAFYAAKSALAVNAAQTATVSRNIAGASESGYSRRVLLVESSVDGVRAGAVERATDSALRDAMLSATSEAAANDAVSGALASLQQTVGDPQSGQSPAALIGALHVALTQAAAAPQDAATLGAAVGAAKTLAQSLNAASAQVQDARAQADAAMAASVDSINSLLSQFASANATVVAGGKTGADVSDAQDRRDAILADLASQIGIRTAQDQDGGVSIFTDSGATLFQGVAREVRMTPTTSFAAGVTGAAVTVDGVAVAGPASTMPTQSGALAGYARIRDITAPAYQAQLDETARGLIAAFTQQDQTGGSAPARAGVFTWTGGPSPPSGMTSGLAGQIAIDPSLDPSAGGNASLLRDGGVGGGAYVYNANGSAYYAARLTALADALGAPQAFDSRAGIAAQVSVADFATNSVAWLEAERKDASDAGAQSTSLASQAKSALGNATGVNIDDQMTQMLNLENNYQASAKMMATVDSMYSALFNAMTIQP